MSKLAIVIGHGPKIDKGAENRDGTTELAWNRGLARLIADAINRLDHEGIIVHRVKEKLQPVKETNATGAKAAVELHLNSYNAKASGTEMIHHPGSVRGKKLAKALQAAAVGVLGLPDRGVKEPQAGGRGARWLRETTMPAVICESFFIDSDFDLSVGNERKEKLALAYAKALVDFVK